MLLIVGTMPFIFNFSESNSVEQVSYTSTSTALTTLSSKIVPLSYPH